MTTTQTNPAPAKETTMTATQIDYLIDQAFSAAMAVEMDDAKADPAIAEARKARAADLAERAEAAMRQTRKARVREFLALAAATARKAAER